MPTITLIQSACTSGLSADWVTISDTGRINITNDVAQALAGPGTEITQISITGRARNSSTSPKYLRLGFKPAANSGRNIWAEYNGASVLDSQFTAIGGANVSGTYIYKSFTRIYSATNNATVFTRFVGHIKERFTSGEPIYLGIINPKSGTSVSVHVSGYWKITITYELRGNIPSTNVNTAVIGNTPVTTTVNKVVNGSSTTIRYKIDDIVLGEHDLGAGLSDTYTPPATTGQYFPTAASTIMTVEAETFLDGVSYGTVSVSVTLTLPTDAAPTCVCTPTRIWVSDVPTSAQIGAYVQTKSGMRINFIGTPKYGASIVGYELVIENMTYVAEATTPMLAHPFFTGSGNIGYVYTVLDSRGLYTQYAGTVTVLPWQRPQIQGFQITRAYATGDGDPIDGTYALAMVQASVNQLPVNSVEQNTLSYCVMYREIAAEGAPENAWVAADVVIAETGATSVSNSARITSGGTAIGGGGVDPITGGNLPFDDMTGYEFQLHVWDIYTQNTPSNALDEMPTKELFWDMHDGTGKMGFGGEAPGASENVSYLFYKEAIFAAGISGVTNYSIVETPTGGRWIDNKPIYHAVMTGTTSLSGSQGLFGSLPAAPDTLLDLRIFVKTSAGWRPLPNTFYGSLNWHCNVYLNNEQVMLGFGSSWSGSRYIVLIAEYTK